jgi:hypothetical protein
MRAYIVSLRRKKTIFRLLFFENKKPSAEVKKPQSGAKNPSVERKKPQCRVEKPHYGAKKNLSVEAKTQSLIS